MAWKLNKEIKKVTKQILNKTPNDLLPPIMLSSIGRIEVKHQAKPSFSVETQVFFGK